MAVSNVTLACLEPLTMTPAAPPNWMQVLLGHGSFVVNDGFPVIDPIGAPKFTTDNDPARQLSPFRSNSWPSPRTRTKHHPVLLAPIIRTKCNDSNAVTEIAYSVYDTFERLNGTEIGRKKVWVQRCSPSGDRGSNVWKFNRTFHYIISDGMSHDLSTCANPAHTTTAYYNGFSESLFIRRSETSSILEEMYDIASKWALSHHQIKSGARRQVVLIGRRGTNDYEALKSTAWYKNGLCLTHWNLGHHQILRERFGNNHGATLDDQFRALGIPYITSGISITRNAANETALIIHLLVSLCFLSSHQTDLLTRGEDLPQIQANVGAEYTMVRVNRPLGARPLTEARPVLTMPTRPSRDSYGASKSHEATTDLSRHCDIRDASYTNHEILDAVDPDFTCGYLYGMPDSDSDYGSNSEQQHRLGPRFPFYWLPDFRA
ncbi:Uu.00g082940.m01.CDS01 [Anthostomella pinea]|uniref:Uu.00g082940.m01.CDS01 n=1 Tax=Anthostomella pinea TaxID=933095 RepID=A0AAI8VLJ5_9PEZI|nr:Uu.00g082940.m01.CDS01 [Anthostomella pinea]